MQVSFNIDDELWWQFRKVCMENKVTASEALRDYIRQQVAAQSREDHKEESPCSHD